MNNRRRLGVSLAPSGAYGPDIETWLTPGALRAYRRSLYRDSVGWRSASLNDEPSLTKVTAISCGPALTLKRVLRSLSAFVSSPLGDFCTVNVFTGSRSTS